MTSQRRRTCRTLLRRRGRGSGSRSTGFGAFKPWPLRSPPSCPNTCTFLNVSTLMSPSLDATVRSSQSALLPTSRRPRCGDSTHVLQTGTSPEHLILRCRQARQAAPFAKEGPEGWSCLPLVEEVPLRVAGIALVAAAFLWDPCGVKGVRECG